MSEKTVLPENGHEQDDIKPVILENIQVLLSQLNVSKVYFIDDAINQDTGKETFKGIVQEIVFAGKINKLREIKLSGIDFDTDETVLLEHIDMVWDELKPGKQLRFFEKVYTITDKPLAINDLNVSNNLKEFFNTGQIVFLTPNDWIKNRIRLLKKYYLEKR